VPSQLLEAALQGHRPFPAIDLHSQILYSAVDQVRGDGLCVLGIAHCAVVR
jgi:hypothetical protein